MGHSTATTDGHETNATAAGTTPTYFWSGGTWFLCQDFWYSQTSTAATTTSPTTYVLLSTTCSVPAIPTPTTATCAISATTTPVSTITVWCASPTWSDLCVQPQWWSNVLPQCPI